jgi:replicative superfamily II helicase
MENDEINDIIDNVKTALVSINDMIKNPPVTMEDVVKTHFRMKKDEIMKTTEEWQYKLNKNLIDIINNLNMKDIVKKYKISSKEQLDMIITLLCNSVDNLIKLIESNTKLNIGEIINHIIDDKIKSEAIKDSTVNEITLQISKLMNAHLGQHNAPINHNPGMTYQYRNDFIDARNEMIELFKGL